MPNEPVFFVGDSREFPAGIHSVSVAHGEKEIAVQQTVGVGVRLPQVEHFALCEGFDGVGFGWATERGAIQVTGPSTAMDFKARGTNERTELQTAGFEFAGEGRGSEICEWFQGTGDQDNSVALVNVPGDAGDSLFEERDRVHVSENQVARNVRKVTLIAMRNGKKTVRQKSQSFRDPATIVGQRNSVVSPQFVEQALFQGGLGQ